MEIQIVQKQLYLKKKKILRYNIMESLSEVMPSSGEPVAYEADKFGSSPEVLKGGRRKSRGRKSRKSRKSGKSRKGRKNTRGGSTNPMGNVEPKPAAMGNGSMPVLGGRSRRRRRKRGGGVLGKFKKAMQV